MGMRVFLVAACVFWSMTARAALTDTESRWIAAAGPVLAYAKAQGLPIDIVVQPQDAQGLAPLAMAYVEGRCKLVLSMRGNPEAQRPLDGVPGELVPVLIEAMVAHELGHCWRYAEGAWHAMPAGFVRSQLRAADAEDEELHRLRDDMLATRREEGYADLVGLAWVASRHPDRYAQVHAWFERVRLEPAPAGSHHDTRAWLRLVKQRSALDAPGTPFERVRGLWQQGLAAED
jgi:hypothetical protein